MKSFFGRRNDSQAGTSKAAASKDPYQIWMPRTAPDIPQRTVERTVPTERREGRSSSRVPAEKPRSSSRAPRMSNESYPTTTLNPSAAHRSHKYGSSTTTNPPAVAPSATASSSQRAAAQSTRPPSRDGLGPSINPNPATFSPHPSLRSSNLPKTYPTSTMNGIYSAPSVAAPAAPDLWQASSSSYARMPREKEREREPPDRYGDRARDRTDRDKGRERDADRVRDKERTRERADRERTKDTEKERERERTRERERDRARDGTRTRSDRYAESGPAAAERTRRERDTDSVFRGSARERPRVREREPSARGYDRPAAVDEFGREREPTTRGYDRPIAVDEFGRDRTASRVVERYRESSQRPSDVERERRPEAERSSRHRRTERDREREPPKEFVAHPKSGKDSSDEGESSDSLKKKYGAYPSSYRRTKVKDAAPSSAWTPFATTVSGQPPNSFPSTSAPNPFPGQAPSQALMSPEPLPVLLSLRLPETHQFQESSHPQAEDAGVISSDDNRASKRTERYPTGTAKPSRGGEASNGILQPPQLTAPVARGFGDDRPSKYQSAFTPSAIPPSRERTDSGNAATLGATGVQASSSSSAFPRVAESVSHIQQDGRAQTMSRQAPASSSRHRNHEQSNTLGVSAASNSRSSQSQKVPSASQQAAAMANSSSGPHSSRRERDKKSKHHGSSSKAMQDATTSINPPAQTAEPAPSLLFQDTQMAHPPSQSNSVNNSPHPSITIRFTPPTPAKRASSVLDGADNPNRPITNPSPTIGGLAPPQYGGTPPTKTSSRSSENDRSRDGPGVQPFKESSHRGHTKASGERTSNKVSHLVAGYEARASPAMEKSNFPSLDPSGNAAPQAKFEATLGTPQMNPGAGPNSSPSFNVSLSSNGRGRVISFSTSNEDGSPHKNISNGSNTGPLSAPTLLPQASDTPSSKHTMTPLSHTAPFAGSVPNQTDPWSGAVQPNPSNTLPFNEYRESTVRPSKKHHGQGSATPTKRASPTTGNGNLWQAQSSSDPRPTRASPTTGNGNLWQAQSSSDSRPTRASPTTGNGNLWQAQSNSDSRPTRASPTTANGNLWQAQSSSDPRPTRALPTGPGASSTWQNNYDVRPSDNPRDHIHRTKPSRSGGAKVSETQPQPSWNAPTDRYAANPGRVDRNVPPGTAVNAGGFPLPYGQDSTAYAAQTNGQMYPSQQVPVSTAPPVGRDEPKASAHTDAIWRGVNPGQVDPIERSTSTAPFSHPKLAELMSDNAPWSNAAPEPVIQPLGSDWMMHQPQLNGKQEEGLAPSAPKSRDRSSPAAEAFSNLHSSSYFTKDAHSMPQSASAHARKNVENGNPWMSAPAAPALQDSSRHNVSANSSKPVSSTMAHALFIPPEPHQPAGNNVTARVRGSSQPEPYAVPARPPSTRPIESSWANGGPIQASTYPANVNGSSRTRGRAKIPESDAFGAPPQPQPMNNQPYYADASGADSIDPSMSQQQTQSGDNYNSYPRKLARRTSEESILKTPSSLAGSVLKPTVSRTSIPVSTSSQQESRKKGIFGMFKKAPQAQNPPQTEAANPYEIWNPPAQQERDFGRDMPLKYDSTRFEADAKPLLSRSKVPPPITVPTTIPAISERKSPKRKVFTPFRYLTSKRNRTVSAASAEAVDGTAPNTVVGSPTASMNSSQPPPMPPPPLRDPQQATNEWRERKESDLRNGRYRVIRPGVVFDVPQEPSQDKQNLRYVKTNRSARASNAR